MALIKRWTNTKGEAYVEVYYCEVAKLFIACRWMQVYTAFTKADVLAEVERWIDGLEDYLIVKSY